MPRQQPTQAPTVAQPFRLPLITTFGNRNETLLKDAKLVNCHAEKDHETGEYWINKRVGLFPYKQYSGNGYGIYNWQGDVYSIFGSTFRRGDTIIGNVDTSNGRYKFVPVLGEPKKLVFSNGVKVYWTEGTTLNELSKYEIERVGYLNYSAAVESTVTKVIKVPVIGKIKIQQNYLTVDGDEYVIVSVGTSDFSKMGYAVPEPTPVIDGHFVVGTKYIINSTANIDGTKPTNFTALGADDNIVGSPFMATYIGTNAATGEPNGVGTARLAVANTVGDRFVSTWPGTGTGTAARTARGLITDQTYMIRTLGSTDFTAVGASANVVGTIFTATGNVSDVGSSDGTVYSPNLPDTTLTKGFVYLDGTLYLMDTSAKIWGTMMLDDPTWWDPLNNIVARVEPDRGVTLAKQLVYVVALKEWTSEVFYDAGNLIGSPLAPVAGAKSPYGCVSADSVQEIDDNLYWVSSNRTVSPQIVRMKDLRVEVISTTPVDRMLDQADFSEVFSWNFKHGGHKFYGVTLKNENLTLVFDIDQDLWYQWTDKDGNYWPIVGETFTPTTLHVTQHETNGALYLLEGDYEYPNDYGNVVPVDIVTSNMTFGVDRRKYLKMMRFNADQTPGSILYVRVSDDDYRSWSQYREVNLGNKRPILLDCGTFYRRAWHFRHFANTPFRIKSTDLQMDIGTL